MALRNIRLHTDDARSLIAAPAAGLASAAVFLLFPDPWPKRRHWKRRLVSEATLAELARVMPPGGELRIATDIADYAEWILLAVRRQGGFRWTAKAAADWRAAGQRLAADPLRSQGFARGRRCSYFRFQRA